MNKTYRTARGKNIDIHVLLAKNERIPAVGNMNVNARGDVIDNNGQVLVPVNERISEQYAQTVGNKSAQIKPQPVVKEERTQEELELDSQFDDDLEIEEIKKKNG